MVAPVYYYHVATPKAPAAAKPNGSHANPYVWHGNTKEEMARQNQVIAQNVGANKPTKVVPPEATDAQQFWCRELDGAYTLRSKQTIQQALQPGHWAVAKEGHAYFVRTA